MHSKASFYFRGNMQDKDILVICPYCGKEAEWVENKEIYGRNHGASHMIWLCRNDNAYVGCHNNTRRPKGILADENLRKWRVAAHTAFDPLWRSEFMTRKEAYRAMRKHFGRDVHIGEADIELCQKIIEWSNNKIMDILSKNKHSSR